MRLLMSIIVLLILSGLVMVGLSRGETKPEIKANIVDLRPVEYLDRPPPPEDVQPVVFPDDFGAHPDYQTEMWAYTGYVTDEAGHVYGVQLTFYRGGLTPGLVKRASEWATNQIYVAQFAITDVSEQTFTYHERFSRGNDRLAGAHSTPYRVWLENWSAQEVALDKVQLKAHSPDLALDLVLGQAKPAVVPDSQKQSPHIGYYYALTNNQARGTITTPWGTFNVTGNLWHHHRWGMFVNLEPEVIGWDWFLLSLNDGREIMYFYTRNEEGAINESSTEIFLVDKDGQSKYLSPDAVELTTHSYWQSPQNEATYPAQWTLTIPAKNIKLEIEPLLADQEIRGALPYWKGVVRSGGTQQGYGYIELSGYVREDIEEDIDSINPLF